MLCCFITDCLVSDVTGRYASQWCTITLKNRVSEIWWAETLRLYTPPIKERELEDEDITGHSLYACTCMYMYLVLKHAVFGCMYLTISSRLATILVYCYQSFIIIRYSLSVQVFYCLVHYQLQCLTTKDIHCK